MTDPRRRNTRPDRIQPDHNQPTRLEAGVPHSAVTPHAPPPDAPVQIRPVRRGQVPTTSIEALSGAVSPAPRSEEPVQVRAYRDSGRSAPALGTEEAVLPARPRSARAQPPREQTASAPTQPGPAPRPSGRKVVPEAAPDAAAAQETAPQETAAQEAGTAPVGPRSGWLSSALNDWLKEPDPKAAPPSRREQAASPEVRREPSTRTQVIQAAPQEVPLAPTSDDRALPRTLQEALASDMLPDLPVELLERLWAQEEEAERARPQDAEPAALSPEPARPEARPEPSAPAPAPRVPLQAVPTSLPEPALPLRPMPEDAHAVVPTLQPMFPGAAPFLARFLPLSAPLQLGLSNRFCDLHAFLKYLHELSWYGYLHVSVGDLSTYALVYEGRVVAAAAVNATGEQALGELLSLYEQGATMATYPLPPTYAHVLSGVGSRAWKFDLNEDFTGLYVHPDGALFYSRGEVVAAMPAGLPYEGAFPAPLRPQTLILPRSFAGWAHRIYVPTLRGRDANNPITSVYHGFREKYGSAGAQLIRALGEGQTPAEYAVRADMALHDLEPLLQELTQGGYLKEQGKDL
ncbi:hypothetical protein [Deinococcus wulumuqiensis]|uniref:hypothetical protein n=1 Tax=Deinococcus wulumuqiensis TaxID=980427 RepID=UPI001F085C8D|nr:hypothetical protein [Deinococcus wulumuqiensis]